MDDVAIARALHVVALGHWFGGVAFVTLVVLPLARLAPSGREGFALFQAVERKFSRQVRYSVPLAGFAGLWMAYRLDLSFRFADLRFWWMDAMLIV